MISAGLDILFISKHSKKLAATLDFLKSLKGRIGQHIVWNDFYSDFNDDHRCLQTEVVILKSKINKIMFHLWCGYATYPVINTFGDVILCCQDFQNLYISGNIMERHLHDIW